MKQVLFSAFESLPFIKTGGLADVVSALSKSMNKKKYEVKVVLPLAKKIKDEHFNEMAFLKELNIKSGFINEKVNVYSLNQEGIDFFFIENNYFFYRDNLYGYKDDVVRFSLYALSVIEMMINLDYYPDILHCHDYHTGFIVPLCKLKYADNLKIKKIRHIFTIHNLLFQGNYNKSILRDYLGIDMRYFEDGTLRYFDHINVMKMALVLSDEITTVSPTYAKEIQGSEFGEGLDSILYDRKDYLTGILNGIDTDFYNPLRDKIYKNYSLKNYKTGKAFNKKKLQEELGLNIDNNTLLVGMVSRQAYQKGIDILLDRFESMLKKNIEIVILGSGEERYERAHKYFSDKYPKRFAYNNNYDEDLAHKIYAGADLLVMPSLFEPCGLSQMIAMRYGTLPLVRETGGLKDSVEPYNEYTKEGRGFSFGPYSPADFEKVFDYAYEVYNNNKEDWYLLMRNAMKYEVSFNIACKKYEDLYDKVLG